MEDMEQTATKKLKLDEHKDTSNTETKPSCVLYGYWQSSSTWRVRIALALKEIEYEYKPVRVTDGEQYYETHTKLNPNARVPTLVIDRHVLNQSGAILEYLEEAYPLISPLMPTDLIQRAKVRNLCMIIGCDIQPIQNLSVLLKVSENTPEFGKHEIKNEWGKHWVTRGFEALEQELSLTAGKYCFGDTVTLADLYLVPQIYNAKRFGVDLNAFPIISRIGNALNELEAFQISHPYKQSDSTYKE